MRTVTVELRNSNALRLLKDLELANIIKVLDKEKPKGKAKLSDKLRRNASYGYCRRFTKTY